MMIKQRHEEPTGQAKITPGIIKYPFWQMTNTFQHAFYVCLNQGEAYAPEEIRRKSVGVNEDIGEVLKEL